VVAVGATVAVAAAAVVAAAVTYVSLCKRRWKRR